MHVGPCCHQLTALIFCAAGFVAAMNKAILQQDYIAYAYICAGAMECGIPNVVPSAFANVSLAAVLVPFHNPFHACCNLQQRMSSAGVLDAVVELCILQVVAHPDPLSQFSCI